MTFLRSHGIVPTKPQPQTKTNNTPEPATPVKSSEPTPFHSQSQPSSSSHSPHFSPADSGVGSGSVPEQTITPATMISKTLNPRRSLRLASKSYGVGAELTSEVLVSSKQRKRKSISVKEDSGAGNANIGLGPAGDEEGEQGFEKAKLGLLEEPNVDMGALSPCSGYVHKVFETVSKSGKRKLSMDDGLSGSDGAVGFLNLRSGKKIIKTFMVSEKKVAQSDNGKLDESGGNEDNKHSWNEVPLTANDIGIGETDKTSDGTQYERKLKDNDYFGNGDNVVESSIRFEENLVADEVISDAVKQNNVMQEEDKLETRSSASSSGDDNSFKILEEGRSNPRSSSRLSREEKGKGVLIGDALSPEVIPEKVSKINDTGLCSASDADVLAYTDAPNDKTQDMGPSSPSLSRRLSRETKGKNVLTDDALPSEIILEEKASEINDTGLCSASDVNLSADTNAPVYEWKGRRRRRHGSPSRRTIPDNSRRQGFLHIARTNAARFAYVPREDENELPGQTQTTPEQEDWPGPFSTAMKIIKDREQKNIQTNLPSSNKGEPVHIVWNPKNGQDRVNIKVAVPSLQELCLLVLLKNADAITSLQYVPDALRHELSQLLCDSRRMNNHFLKLLTQGSPTEIRLRDCSWLTEEEFMESFRDCDTSKLAVLQLDQSGRCMTDYVLSASIAQFSNRLPELATLSITGACRLSDSGLSALASSAPTLRSINLSQCSLLTSASIDILANSLGSSLRELYLDDCQSIDIMLTLPALKKLQHIEALSVAGIPSVCDDFIKDFISSRGKSMKELVLACCDKLTDSSLRVIAEHCPDLHILDLNKLYKLTDSSVGYLANGCQALHTLKLCGNRFSDNAIAAFLEIAGASMEKLSLNNIQKVGHNTAISVAKCANKLQSLDLSWCRSLTDKAVGLIVDSCLSLRVIKLFGCSQITDVLVNGHSNPQIQIIGLKMSPLLRSLEAPDTQGRTLHRF